MTQEHTLIINQASTGALYELLEALRRLSGPSASQRDHAYRIKIKAVEMTLRERGEVL